MTVIDIRARRRGAKSEAPTLSKPDKQEPSNVLEHLRGLLKATGDVVPDDTDILRRLLRDQGLVITAVDLGTELDELVKSGHVRRVVIGCERHIALGVAETTSERAPALGSVTPAAVAIGREDFDAELAIDVETERLLLYRVAVVILSIVGFVLVRAVVLEMLGY